MSDDTVGKDAQQAFLNTMDDPKLDAADMLERGTSQQQVGEMGAETSVTMQKADDKNTVSHAQAEAQAMGIADQEKNKEKTEDTMTDAADDQVTNATSLEDSGTGAVSGVVGGIGGV
ncbi:hypothetical protein [Legionella shakespearei]|uniref:Uncharacterized protein n=1 Tax=Legionella shakespearei DSM 23087 TaxID=1122169 RepID=A0A0W0YLQ3_9GAMM|nr:hypothetical protein [Legionella shakespearei]KTD57518.1 hypothetical protein Lsha_2359 [Legionella shakespearei DSM 23087]